MLTVSIAIVMQWDWPGICNEHIVKYNFYLCIYTVHKYIFKNIYCQNYQLYSGTNKFQT